jgi:hypothetical protein
MIDRPTLSVSKQPAKTNRNDPKLTELILILKVSVEASDILSSVRSNCFLATYHFRIGSDMSCFIKFSLVFLFLSVGCVSRTLVAIRPDASEFSARRSLSTDKFDCRSLMTIVSPSNDPMMLQPLLESEFVSQGFEVVSEAVAKKSLEIERPRSESNDNVSIFTANSVKSAYMFRFSYSTRPDYPHGTVAKSFVGSVVDLRSGRIAASIKFSQGVLWSTSGEAMVEEIVTEVLSKLPCN